MRALTPALILLLVSLGSLACSVNILSAFSNQNTNGALYVEAQTAVNNGDYNGALTKIALMTGAYATTTSVLELKASAQAGLCGFNFLKYVQDMTGIGTARLFPFSLGEFPTATSSSIDSCVAAQNTMLSIGTITQRSANDNMFIALVALAKIGNILNFYARNSASPNAALSTYDPCPSGATPRTQASQGGSMTDTDAGELAWGILLVIQNLGAVASQAKFGGAELATLTGLCTTLSGLGYPQFCARTGPTDFSALELLVLRSLVKEGSAIGLQLSPCPATAPNDIGQLACNCI